MEIKRKRQILRWVFIIAVISFLLNGYAMINVGVSLEYETTFENPCISQVTRRNLCAEYKSSEILCAISGGLAVLCLIFRNKLLGIKPKS